MTEQERIEELVAMLDSFMEDGGGHMNVVVEKEVLPDAGASPAETADGLSVRMDVFRSMDCIGQGESGKEGLIKPMACAVPTLFHGMDEESEEEPGADDMLETDGETN